MARILLTTFGSLGDLHPYLALGKALLARGHAVVLATHEPYRAKVTTEGLEFRPIGVSWELNSPEAREIVAKALDRVTGPRYVLRDMIAPNLRKDYEATLAASEGCDLLVSHPLTMTVRLVAETTRRPWAATALAPLSFFSLLDPPAVGGNVVWEFARWLGPWAVRPLFRVVRWRIAGWMKPYAALRQELGLPGGVDPVFAGQWSPYLNLGLFSRHFAAPQKDWPEKVTLTGFCFHDHDAAGSLTPELAQFLDAGPPPVVFTLGSSAVQVAGSFYREALGAIQRLGCRAVLLIGKDAGNQVPVDLPATIHVAGYAPYSEVFPRARAIVHQGGVGTTAQALRAGVPQLVVPYAQDQPDNARHIVGLGVGRTLSAHRFTAGRAFHELFPLLNEPAYAPRAAAVGRQIATEDGPTRAAESLEGLLPGR